MFALDTVSLSRDFAPRLLEAYQHLEPFPEVASCLRTLKVRGARLAILSNADTDMLDDLADAAKFRDQLEFLISVRVAGTFKPAPAVYELATEVFGVPAGEMTFVSSNRWDAAGAKASGFQTVWVNRTGAPVEYPELQADRVLRDLSEL